MWNSVPGSPYYRPALCRDCEKLKECGTDEYTIAEFCEEFEHGHIKTI